MLTPGFFPFFSIVLSKEQVSPVRAELRIELPFEVFREVESALVLFFAQLIALKDAQFCMHLVVENKCVNSTCIYHSPRLCGTLSWSCVSCDSRVVYSFLHTTKNLGVPGSSRGTLERNRVDLTMLRKVIPCLSWQSPSVN